MKKELSCIISPCAGTIVFNKHLSTKEKNALIKTISDGIQSATFNLPNGDDIDYNLKKNDMNNLELKHLNPYLDKNLNVVDLYNDKKSVLFGLDNSEKEPVVIHRKILHQRTLSEIKPILKNLNNYKDINSKSMKELNIDLPDQMTISELANGFIHVNSVNLGAIEIMAENHIDFNRLIELNLAIDIDTL